LRDTLILAGAVIDCAARRVVSAAQATFAWGCGEEAAEEALLRRSKGRQDPAA